MAVSKVILNGNTLIDTTDKTVTAGSMLSGITALKNDGTTATGSIASKTSSDLTASNLTVTAPAGHYASAATKTLSDQNLVAENIKKDISIFGVVGTLAGGGGNAKKGTVTVTEELTTLTIDIGISNASYFCMFLDTISVSYPGYKSFSILVSNFSRWVALGSNNSGSSSGSHTNTNSNTNGKVELSGTQVTITGVVGSGTKFGAIQPATWIWFAG